MIKHPVVLIVHNVRSAHNVGSILRSADGIGATAVYLTGYTPYPLLKQDSRLPHLALKTHKAIHKTALGAEDSVTWEQRDNIHQLLTELKVKGYVIVTVEQNPRSVSIHSFSINQPTALIVGREVEGIESDVLAVSDVIIEIPMKGKKESLNVSVAAAVALYHCLNYKGNASG